MEEASRQQRANAARHNADAGVTVGPHHPHVVDFCEPAPHKIDVVLGILVDEAVVDKVIGDAVDSAQIDQQTGLSFILVKPYRE